MFPGVDGVIGAADVLEDLLLLEVLDDRLAVGAITPAGGALQDDVLSTSLVGYDAETIGVSRLDGRVGMRIDPSDPASVARLEECARVVTDLGGRSVMVLLEPSWSGSWPVKGTRSGSSVDSQVRAVGVASAIGARSSYSWLTLPASAGFAELSAATTLPILVGAGQSMNDGAVELWENNLANPGVRGMVVPSTLLFAPGEDPSGMLEIAARLVHGSSVAPKWSSGPDEGEGKDGMS